MRHFQKILFVTAVLALGYSIYYYLQLDRPAQKSVPRPEAPREKAAAVKKSVEFNVRDYGVASDEAARMNDYFRAVRQEVGEIIARDETLVISLAEFKTGDEYKRKLYMALSIANRIKVVSPVACAGLKKKLDKATSPAERATIKDSQEYVVCFPGKW